MDIMQQARALLTQVTEITRDKKMLAEQERKGNRQLATDIRLSIAVAEQELKDDVEYQKKLARLYKEYVGIK